MKRFLTSVVQSLIVWTLIIGFFLLLISSWHPVRFVLATPPPVGEQYYTLIGDAANPYESAHYLSTTVLSVSNGYVQYRMTGYITPGQPDVESCSVRRYYLLVGTWKQTVPLQYNTDANIPR